MKNIHLIPTDKPSRLLYFGTSKELTLQVNLATFRTFERSTQHIYITSDEEIKEGDYFLYDETEIRYKTNGTEYHGRDLCHISGNRRYPVNKSKKIILTTDQNLDGVQKIDDEFLQWFVKNPSCEEVAVGIWSNLAKDGYLYHIIIPKEEQKQHLIDIMRGDEELGLYEEPKQETLEEAAERLFPEEKYPTEFKTLRKAFISNAKWQQERMYSEAIEFAEWIRIKDFQTASKDNWIGLDMKYYTTEELFEQFKNK